MIETDMAVALWAMCHSVEFMRQHHDELDPTTVPKGAARYLVAMAIEQWDEHKSLLTPQVMDVVANEEDAQRYGTTLEAAIDVYLEAYQRYDHDAADIRLLLAAAIKWFRSLRLSQQIDEAAEAVESGDLGGAEKALRTGTRFLKPPERGLQLGDFARVKSRLVTPAIPTGFMKLDRAWLGGLHLGQLGTVIAPWNTGKSMILPWFAAQALKANKRVLYYTTEVDEATIVTRIVSAIVRKPINTMDVEAAMKGLTSILNQRKSMAGAEEGDAPEPFFEVMYRDALSLSIKDIEDDLDMMDEEGHHIHLIIADNDDLRTDRKFERGYDMYLWIYTELASLAQRRHVAVWTAAQGNKDSATAKVVQGQHLADSVAKIRKADLALGLSNVGFDDKGLPEMNIHIAKDRYYGTRGANLRVATYFGQGTNGFAAFGDAAEWHVAEEKNADTR